MNLNRQQFIQLNSRYDVIPKDAKVLLALSGGVDSVVLLDLLIKTKRYFKSEIGICYVNHQLRDDVDQDKKLIEHLAEKYRINHVHWGEISSDEWAQNKKLSKEEFARKKRYQILEKVRQEYRYDVILTAHHKGDVAETVLMHILEGTGITGLSGVRLKIGNIHRPLIFFSRPEIEAYARKHQLSFRYDYTNDDLRFKRNKIRHSLIPFLKKEFNPSIEQALFKIALHAREMEQWMEQQAEKIEMKASDWIMRICKKEFTDAPEFLQKFLLDKWVSQFLAKHFSLEHNQFTDLKMHMVSHSSAPFPLMKDIFLWSGRNYIWIYKTLKYNSRRLDSDFFQTMLPVGLKLEGQFFSDLTTAMGIMNTLKKDLNRKPFNRIVVSIGKPELPLSVEQVSGTDWFKPLGSTYKVKVLDYLRDHKLPLPYRIHWPVVKNNKGKVVMVPGVIPDEENSVTQSSKHFLEITVFNLVDFFV